MGELAFEMQAPAFSLWGAWRRLVVSPQWAQPVVLSVQASLRDPEGDETLVGQIRWQEHPGGAIRIDPIDGGATEIIFAPKTLEPTAERYCRPRAEQIRARLSQRAAHD